MFFGLLRDPSAAEVYEKDIRRLRSMGLDDAHVAQEEWVKAKGLIDGSDPHFWGVDIAQYVVRDFSSPDEACRWCARYYHHRKMYEESLRLYKLLADKGDEECMMMVCYYGKNKLAGMTEEVADAYYKKAADLGNIDFKMYFAKKLQNAGDRLGAIAAFQEIVDIGKKDSGSAQSYIKRIYGWPVKTGECPHQCVFCRKWFEDRDIEFFVHERNRKYGHITWEGRCICWQCFGSYDQESVDHMIDIYWDQESEPEKYAEIIARFRSAWGAATRQHGALKRMDWATVVRRENPRFAYVKTCVCCERTVDKREFTGMRFGDEDNVLCRQCLEEYDLDSLLRAASHHPQCFPDWQDRIVALKQQIPTTKELKKLPRVRVSRFTKRRIIPMGNGRVRFFDEPIVFED